MKEKIIKILEEKAECTINGHADFDNVDVTQFEGIAEEIVKLCNLQNVSQQRELLAKFANYCNSFNIENNNIYEEDVDDFLTQ